MYCIKCGKENENTAKFCKFCGTPLRPKSLPDSQVQNRDKKEKKREKEKPENGAKSGRQKWWIILIVILALLLLVCAIFIFNRASTERVVQWQEQYDLGVKYLESGSYEQAILAFEAALEIDPKSVDTYLSLAAAQSAAGDEEAANETINRGFSETGDEQLAVWPLQQKPAAKQTPEPTSTPSVNDENMEESDDQLNDKIDYDNLVTDAYTENLSFILNPSDGITWNYVYQIPQVNLEGDEVTEFNENIYNTLYNLIDESKTTDIPMYGDIVYDWTVNDDVLSLVVQIICPFTEYTEYTAYNFRISSGALMTKEELLSEAEFSQEEYNNLVKTAMYNAYDYQELEAFFGDEIQQLEADTLSDENIQFASPFFDQNGDLCAACRLYIPAGGGEYMDILNLEKSGQCDLFQSTEQEPSQTTQSESTAAPGSLSSELIAQIKEELKVPDDLNAICDQGEAYYWTVGGRYLTYVRFLLNDEVIATATVDSVTGELIRDIITYSGSSIY